MSPQELQCGIATETASGLKASFQYPCPLPAARRFRERASHDQTDCPGSRRSVLAGRRRSGESPDHRTRQPLASKSLPGSCRHQAHAARPRQNPMHALHRHELTRAVRETCAKPARPHKDSYATPSSTQANPAKGCLQRKDRWPGSHTSFRERQECGN